MSFSEWITAHRAYANAFFDYVIEQRHATMSVLDPNDGLPTADAALQALADDDNAEPVPSFLCAQTLTPIDMQHLNDKNVLILGAFSSEGDTFMQYHPVVWYLHCLWKFKPDNNMLCYAAKTMNAAYVFIGNYAEHFDTVKADDTKNQAQAVLEMVARPLAMYKASMQSLSVATSASVIARSPATGDISPYVPLTYAQLLVQTQAQLVQTQPHTYTDTALYQGSI
jgi:hypothetical protein